MSKFENFPNRHEISLSQEKKFSLEGLTIESISAKPEMKGRMRDIDWPIELQGKGKTNEKEKTLHVKFPKGDIILSFITTIHELGHLGQEQLDSSLNTKQQTHDSLFAQEKDAWRRGWDRVMKTRPDILQFLQQKLETIAKAGITDFYSIDEFYHWVQENVLQMVEAQKILFEPDDASTSSEGRFDKLVGELKNRGIDNFLKRYNTVRVGEVVDEEQMISFIKDIAESAVNDLNNR